MKTLAIIPLLLLVMLLSLALARNVERFESHWVHAVLNKRPSERDKILADKFLASKDLDAVSILCGPDSRARRVESRDKSLVYCNNQSPGTGLVFDLSGSRFLGSISGDVLPGISAVPERDEYDMTAYPATLHVSYPSLES